MHQRLSPFIGQHELAGPDILDGLRIAHPAQRDAAQHITAQRQLDDFRGGVGDREQAPAIGVVSQSGEIGGDAGQRPGFDVDPVVGQPHRPLALRSIGRRLLPEQGDERPAPEQRGTGENEQDRQQEAAVRPA
ncbi:hypothetical protein SDC9_158242 [bioreactor metagenome]|uniref:Uncharacterized protein n=1 Tax=bioreactor metagenome TaxID=1076179 RepID=A0A645FEM3_9ZZZZ